MKSAAGELRDLRDLRHLRGVPHLSIAVIIERHDGCMLLRVRSSGGTAFRELRSVRGPRSILRHLIVRSEAQRAPSAFEYVLRAAAADT